MTSLAPFNKTLRFDVESTGAEVPRETKASVIKHVRRTGKTRELNGILRQHGIVGDDEYRGDSNADGVKHQPRDLNNLLFDKEIYMKEH